MRTILTQEQKQDLKNIKQILKEEKEQHNYTLYCELQFLNTIQKELYTDFVDFVDFASRQITYFDYKRINNNYFIKLQYGIYQIYFKEQKAHTKQQKLIDDYFIKICKIEKIF